MMFALPMLAAARGISAFGARDLAGAALWLASVTGEGIADRQLGRFRSEPSNRGKVCREGLWAWSRHPNYFFEWLHWWAYPLLAAGSSLAGFAWAGPFVMFFFLTKITGIPLTEARSLRSRPESYRRYQREVSAFFPLPPRVGVDE